MATPENPEHQRPQGPGRQFFVPSPTAKPQKPAAPKPAAQKPPAQKPRPSPIPAAQKPASSRGRQSPLKPAPVKKSRQRGRKRWLVLIPLLLLICILGFTYKAYSAYSKIERVDLAGVLDPVSGDSTNYLLVGSDSRDAFDPEGSSGVTGRRSDTLI
ncbi:MAG: hypothetical protein F2518_10970, partial [Actinobacteria bacterium]|nr:hypothetical protein [Actinomycetota bacterium]